MVKAYLFPKSALSVTSSSRAHSFKPDQMSHVEIISKLKVTTNPRYKASAGLTYCNVAAHDFATLYGVYLPRVWWTDAAVKTRDWRIMYGQTVRELNANGLLDWMSEWGGRFGWRSGSLSDAQGHVNAGGFAVIIGARKDRSRSGHITVVIPGDLHAGTPAQWQAGAQNADLTHSKWYESPIYEKWGVYLCDR